MKITNNFLRDYRGITYNNAEMVSINKKYVQQMIEMHLVNGCIVISIDDYEMIKLFISEIKEAGFVFTPVYGKFSEIIEDKKEIGYLRSFIIYNEDKQGNSKNFKDLLEFGLNVCKKYNQSSFLVHNANEKPKFIKQDGSTLIEFEKDESFFELVKKHFNILIEDDDATLLDVLVNPRPQCYGERHMRWISGEVF